MNRENIKTMLFLAAIVIAAPVGMFVQDLLTPATATATSIGGGRAGPAGPAGPTGPNWTTCAELASSITDETGTCGGPVLSVAPQITGAAGFSGATTFSSASGPPITVTTPSGVTAVNATANGANSSAFAGTAANFNTSYGLVATGAGTAGRGIRIDVQGGGYPMVVLPDTTSPITPHMSLTAQTLPSACVDGDLTMQAGGIVHTCHSTNNYKSASNAGTTGTAAAAGTNQATATALTAGTDFWNITGCDGTKGVTLTQGLTCLRIMAADSTVTNTCKVYGHNSDNDTINGGAADAAYVQIAGSSLVYCTADATAWFTY